MTSTQVLTRMHTSRRTALALLAGFAVMLGAVAAAPAGTAHAGGVTGGVLGDVKAARSIVGNEPDVAAGTGGVEAAPSKPGGTGDGIRSFGSKLGIGSGSN